MLWFKSGQYRFRVHMLTISHILSATWMAQGTLNLTYYTWSSCSSSLINGFLLQMPPLGQRKNLKSPWIFFSPRSSQLPPTDRAIFWTYSWCLAFSKWVITAGCCPQPLLDRAAHAILFFTIQNPLAHGPRLIHWPFFDFGPLTILSPCSACPALYSLILL